MQTRPVIKTSKFMMHFLSYTPLITAIIFLFASFYLIMIINDQIAEKAKVQENALLAGLVEDNWRDSAKLRHFINDLNQFVKKGQTKSDLRDYIYNAFSQMRIEVFRHNFQTISSSFLQSNSTSGENVYAIVRAYRTASVEAILLTVPIRSTHIESIAIALSFADYAKRQLYWARDLVFFFVDGGNKLATEAWLSDYHGLKHPFFIQQQGVMAHGGSFIGAFGLDIIGTLFEKVELHYSMVNGKLPNMDLLNLFILLVEKAGSVPSINGVVRARNEFDFIGATQTFANGVISQSLSEPESLTAVFGRFGLHAVTIRTRQGISTSRHQITTIDLADMVRLVEGATRSLNNLLEKFHHSYLLYVIIHPHRFVPAAIYMPLLGLLLAPLLLMALHEWFEFGGANNLVKVGTALSSLSLIHLSALCFYGLQVAMYSDYHFSARKHVALLSLLFPVLALFIVCIFHPRMNSSEIHFLRFMVFMELALFLNALGLVHFTLAFLLTALFLPVVLVSSILSVNSSFFSRICCFLLLNPLSLAIYAVSFTFHSENIPAARCWELIISRVAKIAYDHFAHGSWLLPLLSGPVLAIYLAFAQIIVVERMEREQ